MTLKELRTAAGMTQSELAERCNRARSYIGKIECGNIDINNIALGTAYKLAQALGVPDNVRRKPDTVEIHAA